MIGTIFLLYPWENKMILRRWFFALLLWVGNDFVIDNYSFVFGGTIYDNDTLTFVLVISYSFLS